SLEKRIGKTARDLGVVAGPVAPVVREPCVSGPEPAGPPEDQRLDELLGRKMTHARGPHRIVEAERLIDQGAVVGARAQHAGVPHAIAFTKLPRAKRSS